MNDRPGMERRAAKRSLLVLLIAIVVCTPAGCSSLPIANDNGPSAGSVKDGASVAGGAGAATATPPVKNKAAASRTGPPPESKRSPDEVAVIALGDTIAVKGSGASVDGSVVRITSSGTYIFGGALKDGQIIVDTKDKKPVNLVLDGVDIKCASSAPIYVMSAETTVIALADGTENHVTHGISGINEDPQAEANEPNAAIFSKGNLTFKGNGSLTVEANYRNGIASKDELNITGGSITVNAVNDGIKGRDYITIKNGNVTVNAKADGMQSNNDEDLGTGFISIESGSINITAIQDGIQAATSVLITGGTLTVSSGGGSANGRHRSGGDGSARGNPESRSQSTDNAPAVSAKGIKAGSDVKIAGGRIVVDSSDDAINSNGSITIDGGNIVLASGDDGVHADAALTTNGGDVGVTRSYEALESAVVTITGGSMRLKASDDGINVAVHDRSAVRGRLGQSNPSSSVDEHLRITGGYVVVDATGDGLDINGWAKMTGGTVIVNGPTVSYNGAVDYAREFTMAGGTLVTVGSFGMAQAPDATSTQSSLVLSLGSPQPAGTLVHIEAEDGTGILTFAPIREYQSVVYSSPELKKGTTYSVYLGGSSTGSVVDGVYTGGSYTPGKRTARATVSNP